MPDNLSITPGSGAQVATDEVGGVHIQIVKLASGAADSVDRINGDPTHGLDVDVTRVQGNVTVVDGGGSLTVDSLQLPASLTGGGNLKVSIQETGVSVPVTDASGSLTVDTPQLPGTLTGSGNLRAAVLEALPAGSNIIGKATITQGGNDAAVSSAGALKVDGSAVTQPISAAALPLPAGAATEATLAGIKTGTDKIPTSPAQEHVTAASPHAARLTDGSAFYDAAKSSQLPTSLVGGRLDVHVGNTPTVAGAVTSNQGTPAAAANAWPVKVSDGVDSVGISTVGANKALRVDVLKDVSDTSKQDKTTFTEGADKASVAAGVFNDTPASDPAEDQAAALRITAKRGLHVNLRTAAGAEIGTGSSPVRIDPTGTTTQPVSGTVTANQGSPPWAQNITQVAGNAIATAASGIPKVGLTDEAGAAYAHANPLQVAVVPQSESAQWRAANTYAASETNVAIFTPSGGKRFVVCGIIITVTAVGVLKVFDNTNTAANMLYQGSPPVGVTAIPFTTPWMSSAANNVLRYSTGTGAGGDITVYGYQV